MTNRIVSSSSRPERLWVASRQLSLAGVRLSFSMQTENTRLRRKASRIWHSCPPPSGTFVSSQTFVSSGEVRIFQRRTAMFDIGAWHAGAWLMWVIDVGAVVLLGLAILYGGGDGAGR